ncbi:hypothetical protein ACFFHM_03235 [Halalkalibacter kiskunsagensis]|uniref:DUF5659 domain-containing protein n=1 Tax=Halalkalibacter kiskunsagensis TaxID=1548599 RepID=A0ABV6K8D5_9BACI
MMNYVSKKRIFNERMKEYLIEQGAIYLYEKEGEVEGKPDRVTYFFKKDERLSKAMNNYKRVI